MLSIVFGDILRNVEVLILLESDWAARLKISENALGVFLPDAKKMISDRHGTCSTTPTSYVNPQDEHRKRCQKGSHQIPKDFFFQCADPGCLS